MCRSFFYAFLASLSTWAAWAEPVASKGWNAKIFYPLSGPAQIFDLEYSSSDPQIFVTPLESGAAHPVARVEGWFRREGWDLYHDGVCVRRAGQGVDKFVFNVPLRGKYTFTEVAAVGPGGEVHAVPLFVCVPNWRKYHSKVDLLAETDEPMDIEISLPRGFERSITCGGQILLPSP